MKAICWLCFSLFVLVLSGCSEAQPSPEENLKLYIASWEQQNFAAMYDLLTAESQKNMTKENFVKRYESIYTGIEASGIQIKPIVRETAEEASADQVQYDYTLQMNTSAGPVQSAHFITLIKQRKNDRDNWYISWKPSLIFPVMAEGDKVKVKTIQPNRGDILDRNGGKLATAGEAIQIGLVSGQFEKNPETVKQKIADTLQLPLAEIDKKMHAGWVRPDFFVPVTTVPPEDARLHELDELPGVASKKIKVRYYPYREATAHLVGYVGEISGDASWGRYSVTRVSDPHLPVNLQRAFIYSDNIYFAQVALDMGQEAFMEEAAKFGFHEKLPVPYPITPSSLANGEKGIRSDIQLADSGYGQGEVQMSPLHVALAYTAFVNGGSIRATETCPERKFL